MLKTNSNAYKAKVYAYLCESIYDFEGTEAECAAHIWERFNSEYNYPDNRKRIPNLQERVADWLAGIPLNIAVYSADIMQLAESWAETRYTDKQAERIIDNWFNFMAFQILKFWEKHGINPYI
ncbi:hypothetical protein RCCWILLIS_91 [Rhodobacter phage RcCWillis]|nr:hypothetical protein RCCWILLIS_91 [Rhodobacter phage RcCWillis]